MSIFNTNNIFNSASKVKSQQSSNDENSALEMLDWIGDIYDMQSLTRDTSGNGFWRGKKIAEIISRFFGNYGG